MSSKELSKPLKPASLRDVQPVSDRDDDQSSPECLLSLQPVEDNYSSDDEAKTKEPMLTFDILNASESVLWEVANYIDVQYDSFESSKEMLGISTEDLLTESLKFYYTDGPPEFYKEIFKLDKNASWDNASSYLYEKFEAGCIGKEWLRKKFSLDYGEATDDDIRIQSNTIFQCSVAAEFVENNDSLFSAYNVAARLNKLLVFLREDEIKRCVDATKPTEDNNDDRNEKHHIIRGVLCEIFAYLRTKVLYKGECKLDFDYNVMDRTADKASCIKVRPDVTAFLQPGGQFPDVTAPSEPFMVCQVFGTSSVRAQEKASDKYIDYDSKKKGALRAKVTSCGPSFCSTDTAADKLYGQLVLQLYGALLAKKDSRLAQENLPTGLDSGYFNCLKLDKMFGLFVMNEYVFLAKMTRDYKYNKETKCSSFTKKVIYAKNLWFNLKKPNERMAFISFLFHVNIIERREMNSHWLKWFPETSNGANPENFFSSGKVWN